MAAPHAPVKAIHESFARFSASPRIRYGFIAFDRFLSIDKNRRQNMINLLTGVGLARAQAPDSRVAGEEVNEID